MERMADQPEMQRPQGEWSAYFDAVAGLPARETLLAALQRFELEPPAARIAVDLGCGEGRDTAELLRRGWRVLAIDSQSEAIDRLRSRVTLSDPVRLATLVARYEDASWPVCDLVNASFSIPHTEPADFPVLWGKIVASIRTGGRFAGQFFGVRDSWATRPDGVTRTYHTRADVEGMLRGFEAEQFEEIERPGKNALGEPKYWHVFHVVARKTASD
jgi:SAM-dependent methyltransferase